MSYFAKGMELLNEAMERNRTELKIKFRYNRGNVIELNCRYNPLTRQVKFGCVDYPITGFREKAKSVYGIEILSINGGGF